MTTVSVVEAKITADTAQFDKSMGRIKGSLGALGTAAKNAARIASTALVGAAAQGVTAFAGFETGMNEVFTLLPGISADAMGTMEDDVKNFSKEFGVMTDDAIPALYQALSAGVPQDNVFEFLETAQQAAKGGVTDLETAVDGISSVVNAYGADVMSATEASDLMFTAVRLGKTDFGQLSASLFQVAPIASSMGVGFDQVTAALAALTAKGVPTTVAATQIKGAISELGKEGTIASDAFKEISGVAFTDFIASGGDIGQAFQMMSESADAAGASVLDSFGSIEAGQAVLALTAGGGESFASALDEMGVSSGATGAAFEQMDQGLSATFSRIKAGLQVLLIDIGEKLAPFIERAIQFIIDNFGKFQAKAKDAFETASKVIGHLADAIEPVVKSVVELAEEVEDFLSPAIEAVTEFAEELVDAFMQGGVGGAADYVKERLRPIGEWMERNKPIIAGVAAMIGTVLVASFVQWAVAAASAAAATIAAAAPFIALVAAIGLVTAGLVYAYQNFEKFRKIVDAVVDGAQAAFRWFMDDGVPILKGFGDVVVDVVRDVIERFQSLYDFLKPIFEFILQLYIDSITELVTGAQTIYGAIQSIIGFFGDLYDGISGFVGDTIDDVQSMIDFILDIPNKLTDLAGDVKDKFVEVGSAILDGIAEGVGAATDFISDFAKGIGNGIIDVLNTRIIQRINNGIPDKIEIPFAPDINLPDNPIPHIPKLADGGIVTRPTLAMVGEGGESEAVIPLSRLDRMMGGGGGGGGQTINVTVNMPVGSDGADVVASLQRYARSHGGTVPILTGQL